MVPFVDLKRQYKDIKDEVNDAIQGVIDNTQFILGEELKLFEKEFADYCGVKNAVGVANGTDALFLALLSCDIGASDEVITVPNTFIATVEAISYTGAQPIFVDIDSQSYNLSPSRLREFIETNCDLDEKKGLLNKKSGKVIKALIPVHLYGQPADMDEIMNIARKYHLLVIEDACQAHGSEYKGKRAGSMGDIGCFSFYPGKNLGAYGDGGMVTTNNDEMTEKVKILRDHGKASKFDHKVIGYNSRLDCLQAAILRVKLRKLDGWNERRRENAAYYGSLLDSSKITLPFYDPKISRHVFHLFVIRSDKRNELMEKLPSEGISFGIHYPMPVHLTGAYSHLNYKKGDFPVAEKYADEILSLPMFPELTKDEISVVAKKINGML